MNRLRPNTQAPAEAAVLESARIAFGPIPSRRLGQSLGINNIPPKVCTYSCVYCQAGPTTERPLERRQFYSPTQIVDAVTRHLELVQDRGVTVEHLTFAPEGEPTLDARLGETIRMLQPLGIDIAVFTNATLLDRSEVREALDGADWVSVKVDAVEDSTWRRIDRPHPELALPTVLHGIERFAAEYSGQLVSETMLVADVNDTPHGVEAVAQFLSGIQPHIAYLGIPTRPTPYATIVPPDEATVTEAYHIMSRYLPRVECLLGYEGDAFAATGDPRSDILAITAVHPLRPSALARILEAGHEDWSLLDELVKDGLLSRVEYRGEPYFVRRWRRSS